MSRLNAPVRRSGIIAFALILCLKFGYGCLNSTAAPCASDCDTDSDSDSDGDSDTDSDSDSDGDLDSDGDTPVDEQWECYLDGGPDSGGDQERPISTPNLVCVFDIDDTLTCENSAEAVRACKDLGARLAVNTAESHDTALNNKAGLGWVDWAGLGFPTEGVALDMSFDAFMFGRCYTDCSCSEEYGGEPGDCEWCEDCGPDCPASYMGKAYGMYRIAKYYDVEPNKCLVLFDDTNANTEVAETFCYSAYNQGDCELGWDNEGVYQEVYDYLTGGEFDDCLGF